MKAVSTKRGRRKSLKSLMKKVKVIEIDFIPGVSGENLFPEELEQAKKFLRV